MVWTLCVDNIFMCEEAPPHQGVNGRPFSQDKCENLVARIPLLGLDNSVVAPGLRWVTGRMLLLFACSVFAVQGEMN